MTFSIHAEHFSTSLLVVFVSLLGRLFYISIKTKTTINQFANIEH